MKSCDRCRFAEIDPENKQLWCHYAPPIPVGLPNGSIQHTFPAVRAVTWCGAFKWSLKRLFKGYGGA